jgi:acyl-CoA synthetase (NDP forming)
MDLPAGVADLIGSQCAAGRAAGLEVLTEVPAQEIARALGLRVPRMVAAPDPETARRAGLRGARVVVKAAGLLHKTDAGGVLVAENDHEAIAAAARSVGEAAGAAGCLVVEHVDHDPAAEILAGVRWSDAFGPVVTIGVGGIAAEATPLEPVIVAPATAGRIAAALDASPAARLLTGGLRGRPPAADAGVLADLAARLLALGEAAMPHDLVEFEVNPLVVAGGAPVSLDALAVLGSGERRPGRPPLPEDGLQRLLRPGSIVVVGVSERMNPGRVILRNVLAAGYPPERVTVVKPGLDEIDGCRCVPDLGSLDGPADLMVLSIAADAAPAAVEHVVAVDAARALILIPGGLGERPGTEAAAGEIRNTVLAARRSGRRSPVVIGPNSMGARSRAGRYDTTFIPPERMTPDGGRPAPVAVIAQSGAFTLSRLDRLPWLRPASVITVGNQLDVSVGDCLAHFAGDPGVEIAACYLEGFAAGDGDRSLRAAARFRERGGTVLWYRGGRTTAGARSAASHTAAVATDDRVARSLAAAAGILEAATLDEFEDLLRLAVLLCERPPAGLRFAAVSNAGFECVAAADALGPLEVAGLSGATRARLEQILTDWGLVGIAGAQNPLDLTPIAGDAAFATAVEAVLDDPGVDLAVVGCVPYTPALQTLPDAIDAPGSVVGRLAALAGHPTPWAAVVDGGRRYDPMAGALEAAGVPVLRSMDRAVRLLGRYAAARLGSGF